MLSKDPPFSKIDLITCRNLLIYMGSDLQKYLIPLFHYSLNPGGFLFLGNSESVTESSDLFNTLNRKTKIYQRKEEYRRFHDTKINRFSLSNAETKLGITHMPVNKLSENRKIPLRELTESALLQQIAPAAALVNSNGDILYLHGRTGLYLEPAPGESGINNILKMAREGLRDELNLTLRKAIVCSDIVVRRGLRVKTNGDFTAVDLKIVPVTTPQGGEIPEEIYLVILAESEKPYNELSKTDEILEVSSFNKPVSENDVNERIIALQNELIAKEAYLQTTIEELQTTNEELKSSNEEMQSVNEELQSTNEEMETSKEELQSVNEELITVNSELQNKLSDLTRVNNDINNLISGTGIATVFVDHQQSILRFTPMATQIINLISSDIGRPLGHIVSNLKNYDRLVQDVQTVLDTLIPKELEVQTLSEAWYMLRIQPYRTIDNKIDGAVVTFFEITEIKHAEQLIKALLEEKEVILKEVHHRVKNNMNTLQALLNLQTARSNETAVIKALGDVQNRILSLTVLYNQLYDSNDFDELSVNKYIPALASQIIANFPNSESIKLETSIEDFILEPTQIKTLGILLNEVLTNAMKYAFIDRKEGLISISIGLKDNRVSVSIRDNGIGIPEGVDLLNSNGFGFTLIRWLTKQLSGETHIINNDGTAITLEFDR